MIRRWIEGNWLKCLLVCAVIGCAGTIEIVEKAKKRCMEEAFTEGVRSYNRNEQVYSNPHIGLRNHWVEAKAWQDGWLDAKDKSDGDHK